MTEPSSIGDADGPTYSLRPATIADLDFVCDLRERTLSEYIDRAFGWDADEQRAGYDELLRGPEGAIVVVKTHDVGFLHFGVEDGTAHLHEIVIQPEHQDRGLGSTIIRDLCARSEGLGLPLELGVLRENTSAVRLYERLGFEVFRRSDATLWMRWMPGP